MEEIKRVLERGGEVYHFDLDMYVLAVFDTLKKQEVFLGDPATRKVYFTIDGRDVDIDEFIFTE